MYNLYRQIAQWLQCARQFSGYLVYHGSARHPFFSAEKFPLTKHLDPDIQYSLPSPSLASTCFNSFHSSSTVFTMIRQAPRHLLRCSRPLHSPQTRRLLSTAPPAQKSRSWKSSAVRWGLAIGVVYYYNTSNLFAEEPPCETLSRAQNNKMQLMERLQSQYHNPAPPQTKPPSQHSNPLPPPAANNKSNRLPLPLQPQAPKPTPSQTPPISKPKLPKKAPSTKKPAS